MKKHVLFTILLFYCIVSPAQNTWQRTFHTNTSYSIDQLLDGGYICSFDSAGNSYVVKLSAFGKTMNSFTPVVRTSGEDITGIEEDPHEGYAICGTSPDIIGAVYSHGFFAHLDTMGNVSDTVFFPPGTVSGSGRSVRITPDSNYIASGFNFNGAGNGNGVVTKVIYPDSNSWSASGSSGMTSNGIEVDARNRTLFTTYTATAAAIATVDLIDSIGNTLHTLSVTDTVLGGSLVFASSVGLGTGDRYGFGCNVSPNSLSHGVIYFICLDTAFNRNWTKVLDWGSTISLISIVPTSDSGFALLINKNDSIFVHRVNAAGDSLWTQAFTGIGHAHGNTMRNTSDNGFIIIGSTDSVTASSFGYVLKLDSMGSIHSTVNILPPTSLIFCPGDTVMLAATSGFSLYEWSTGETSDTAVITQQGTYWVNVTDSMGFRYVSDTIVLLQYTVTVPVISQTGNTLHSTPGITYQWFDANGLIIGATSDTLSPTSSGFYTVEITDLNGCRVLSDPYNFIFNGLVDLQSSQLNIYSYNKIIHIESNFPIGEITLVNMLGQRVKYFSSASMKEVIDVSTLEKGVYVVIVKSSGKYLRELIEVN